MEDPGKQLRDLYNHFVALQSSRDTLGDISNWSLVGDGDFVLIVLSYWEQTTLFVQYIYSRDL